MAKDQSLSLRVQWLGDRLRQHRERLGLRLEDAAGYLQMHYTTLGRFERGEHRPKPSYVRDLVDHYGISDPTERRFLLQLNDDAWRKDFYDGDTSGLDMEFLDYTWLEERAARILAYAPLLVIGLLQTPQYAQTLASAACEISDAPEDFARTAETRASRQRILTGQHPTTLEVLYEEAALLRPIGDHETHKGQLEHLHTTTSRSNIDIRILRRDKGWHPGLDGPFMYLDMPDPYPDVVYIEHLGGRLFVEEHATVDKYRQAYNYMHQYARDSKESGKFIKSALKDLE
ncbi:MAG TPA: helix-turn-helix transcriptional regulator [Stackebrandtia sp.]|jgi:transcriptional regulator with XRE-family HTH domain|uniref:helix-turn-helix domain-containing protein n=1 Tax=Stackebrandtia sp. TaxID=2023065 RepID=UPI002D708BD6|nr:helix-turn-helix transcriptional regulator [Stackebrandtia sp.]HZE41939.1 helix-turn-helix transcriptional regulator [Stackebrandtia sp.]